MRSIAMMISLSCWMGTTGWVVAQDNELYFRQAQQALEQKQYQKAQQHCRTILRQSPQHWDAHLLLTYASARQGKFEEAEASLTQMYAKMTSMDSVARHVLHEAILCETRLSYWKGNNAEAIRRANRGMILFPESLALGMLKGKAALGESSYDTAITSFDQVLVQQPDFQEAQRLRDEAYWRKARYQAGVSYGHQIFTRSAFPRHTVNIELTRFWKTLTLTGRISRSYQFGIVSHQTDLEGWKLLSRRWYLYGQLACSDARLFPRYRASLEPYYKVGASVEVSAGVRYFRYIDQPTWMYTASASKYLSQGMVMTRVLYSPTPAGGRTNFEAGGRWFMPDAYNFVELKVGSGISPDNTYLGATYQEIRRSHSLYTILGVQKRFPHQWLGKVWGVVDQQMPEPGTPFSVISLNAGVWKRF